MRNGKSVYPDLRQEDLLLKDMLPILEATAQRDVLY